jgi:glycosyltransferase involved in cell wall biosynthesis
MRILLVSDHYPPYVGGVQRQTRAMAMELSARGHEVGVVTVWQDTLPSSEQLDGFPVWRLRQVRSLPGIRGRARRRHQPPWPDPVSLWQLRGILRRFRPDVVHSSGWFTYSAAAALLGSRTPLIVSIREYGFICSNASLLHKGQACSGPELVKCASCSHWYHGRIKGTGALIGVRGSAWLIRRKATAVHNVSAYVEESVVPRLFEASRTPESVVIPSFYVPDPDRADAEFLSRLPSAPFILFVGALRRVKGVQILLDAYTSLRDPPPLVLLGTFEKDTPAPLPDGVHAPGAASFGTVMEAWKRCLFGVMPSLWPEPFGSVIHEAMLHGKAVIGTIPGGHSDMIENGRTGLLVPSGDLDALRAAMQSLIDNESFRDELGSAAAQAAPRFSAPVVVPQFEGLYRDIADKPSAPTPSTNGHARRTREAPLRILMLAQSYAPTIGGEERLVQDLSRELVSRGHSVSVATLTPTASTQDDGVAVHVLRSSIYRLPLRFQDAGRRHAVPAPDPETVADLRRVIKAERPDVIHAHNWLVHSYLPLRRALGVPVVMSLHDYALICATKRLFRDSTVCSGPGLLKCAQCAGGQYGRWLGAGLAGTIALSTRYALERVDRFVAISGAVRDACGLHGDHRCSVIPNLVRPLPAPVAAREPLLRKLPGEPYVLFFGDATVDKGAALLARVYDEIPAAPPLVFVGRPLVANLHRHRNVVLAGPMPHPIAIQAVRDGMFTVVPSQWAEPFGLVALESAAAGKAVVASDIGGLASIVEHEKTGLLVKPGDGYGLRVALERMIADAPLRDRLGHAARSHATRFAPEVIVPRFEELYRELLA